MKIILIILISCMVSCLYKNNKVDQPNNKLLITDSSQYVKDKEWIKSCFIENVENYRKYHRYDLSNEKGDSKEIFDRKKKEAEEYYNKYPEAKTDPANLFESYATRYSLKEDKYVASPVPTLEQIEVRTDTIIYSKDSLLCVAFLVINNRFSDVEGLES